MLKCNEYNMKKSLDKVIYDWFQREDVISYIGKAVDVYCKDDMQMSLAEAMNKDYMVIWKSDESIVIPNDARGNYKKQVMLSFFIMTRKDDRNEYIMKIADAIFELCYPMKNIPIYDWQDESCPRVSVAILKGVIDENGILVTSDGFKIRELDRKSVV